VVTPSTAAPDHETIQRHDRIIASARRQREHAQSQKRWADWNLAEAVREAKREGIPHMHIADALDLTKDGLTKFLRRNKEQPE
jgi:hypothetical protein